MQIVLTVNMLDAAKRLDKDVVDLVLAEVLLADFLVISDLLLEVAVGAVLEDEGVLALSILDGNVVKLDDVLMSLPS